MIVWKRYIVAATAVMLLVPATSGAAQSLAMMQGPGRVAQATVSVLDLPARLEVENVPLAEALLELESASGVSVAFSPSLVDRGLRVSCACRTRTVGEVLDRLLAPTSLRYVVLGEHVVIEPAPRGAGRRANRGTTMVAHRPMETPAVVTATLWPTTRGTGDRAIQGTITGRVTDVRSGQAVVGAQVFIPGAGIGALTDRDGRYVLRDVAPGTVVVRVQSIGFATAEQTVTVVSGQTVTLDFTLVPEAIALDEVVVTATGEARAREMGTSMARITSREIQARPARNTQELLTAAAPGIDVLQNTGQPGAGATIRLRGNNSISQGNDPIIYIDGVRVYGGSSPTHPAARQSSSPLNDINASDIERIEVIKGAAATTLYGTEASSGVIHIFTKKGATGAPRWSADITTGINNIGHVGPKSDPTGMWLNRCRGEGLVSYDGRVFEDPTCPESGSWLRNALVQNYALSVGGGIDQVTYYLSGHFSDEQNVVEGAGGSSAGGFLGNFTVRPLPGTEISINTSLTRRETDWLPSGDNGDAFMLNVTRGFGSNFTGATGCKNPDAICVGNGAILTADNTSKSTHFVTGFTVQHRLGDRLTNRVSIGYDYNNSEIESIRPFGYPRFPVGDMTVRDWRQTLFSLDYVGTFKQTFGGGSLTSSFSWGGQLFANDSRTITMTAEEFAGPGKPTLESAARRSVSSDNRERVVNAGFFFQEEIGYKDKLFVTAGLRVDGNSAFGKDFGLQAYPKLMASYIVSDEDFWPFDWWEAFKLRAAIGESGRAPGAFDAVRTWDPIAGDEGQAGFTPGQLGNPTLGPERSREVEAGFEAGFFGGRVGVDFTYYNQRTFDALIPVRFPPSQGFLNTQLENVGELKNTGIELRLNVDFVRRQNFAWTGRFDYATVNSEAVDLGGEVITVQTFGRTYVREGYPVPAIFGMKIVNPDEYADPIFEEDAFIGSAYPTKTIALGSGLTLYRDITIDALGEFKLGGHMVNGNGYQNSRRGAWPACYDIQRRVKAGEDISDVTALMRARCALDGGPIPPSYDAWIESTDFFRLRSVSISYQLPQGLIPGASSATLRLAGRNLWTKTDYSGTDPELDDYRGSLARRDYYVLPTYRSFLATLRVSF